MKKLPQIRVGFGTLLRVILIAIAVGIVIAMVVSVKLALGR